MMPIFSQFRADMYESALRRERNEIVDLSGTPPHLTQMLYDRTGKRRITFGDITDHFAPTFEEARILGMLRAKILQLALDMFDEKQKRIAKRSLPSEIIDFMFDKLPPGQPYDSYSTWDVIEALRPTNDEAVLITEREKDLKQDWQDFLNSIDPPASEDGTFWNDGDLNF